MHNTGARERSTASASMLNADNGIKTAHHSIFQKDTNNNKKKKKNISGTISAFRLSCVFHVYVQECVVPLHCLQLIDDKKSFQVH